LQCLLQFFHFRERNFGKPKAFNKHNGSTQQIHLFSSVKTKHYPHLINHSHMILFHFFVYLPKTVKWYSKLVFITKHPNPFGNHCSPRYHKQSYSREEYKFLIAKCQTRLMICWQGYDIKLLQKIIYIEEKFLVRFCWSMWVNVDVVEKN
jgi:hypothetical protein